MIIKHYFIYYELGEWEKIYTNYMFYNLIFLLIKTNEFFVSPLSTPCKHLILYSLITFGP